jgi:hypothetical protein
MKLILTDDDGVLLDETPVTRAEWDDAQRSPLFAQSIITQLSAGSEAH